VRGKVGTLVDMELVVVDSERACFQHHISKEFWLNKLFDNYILRHRFRQNREFVSQNNNRSEEHFWIFYYNFQDLSIPFHNVIVFFL